MSFHAELVNTVSFLVDEGKPYRLFLEMAGEKEPWVTESVQTWGDGFISFDAVNGTVVTLKTAHIISFWVKSGE